MDKEISEMSVQQLKEEAKGMGIEKISKLSKQELLNTISETKSLNVKKYAKLKVPVINITVKKLHNYSLQ